MGTRSITHIHEMLSLDPQESIVCSFYRQYDGYPEGHGKDLVKWLKDKKLINGLKGNENPATTFNRSGTMAVKLCSYIQQLSGCEIITMSDKQEPVDYVYNIYYRNDSFDVYVTATVPITQHCLIEKCCPFCGESYSDD